LCDINSLVLDTLLTAEIRAPIPAAETTPACSPS
jgi:hypothetical protein